METSKYISTDMRIVLSGEILCSLLISRISLSREIKREREKSLYWDSLYYASSLEEIYAASFVTAIIHYSISCSWLLISRICLRFYDLNEILFEIVKFILLYRCDREKVLRSLVMIIFVKKYWCLPKQCSCNLKPTYFDNDASK